MVQKKEIRLHLTDLQIAVASRLAQERETTIADLVGAWIDRANAPTPHGWLWLPRISPDGAALPPMLVNANHIVAVAAGTEDKVTWIACVGRESIYTRLSPADVAHLIAAAVEDAR